MMRSLWTAASGMNAQQLNVDTISNNISNVNTTGYKKERLEFKSLLYQTMERATLDKSYTGKPVNLQVGLGVRPIATSRVFSQGNLERTDNKTDVAIQGQGFFMIKTGEEEVSYSRDGNFKISVGADGQNNLVTSEGYFVLNTDGEPVSIPSTVAVEDIAIGPDGAISYMKNGEQQDLGIKIGLVQFPNPQGLEAVGGNLYRKTSASGEPILEADGEVVKSTIAQGFREMGNVNIADEMVNLIVAQRAYELNSKAITTSDEMLQQANNLKR